MNIAQIPGAPFPLLPSPAPKVVSEFGDYASGDGGQLVIIGPHLVFMLRTGETEVEIGIELNRLLEAIGQYNKATES